MLSRFRTINRHCIFKQATIFHRRLFTLCYLMSSHLSELPSALANWFLGCLARKDSLNDGTARVDRHRRMSVAMYACSSMPCIPISSFILIVHTSRVVFHRSCSQFLGLRVHPIPLISSINPHYGGYQCAGAVWLLWLGPATAARPTFVISGLRLISACPIASLNLN